MSTKAEATNIFNIVNDYITMAINDKLSKLTPSIDNLLAFAYSLIALGLSNIPKQANKEEVLDRIYFLIDSYKNDFHLPKPENKNIKIVN